MQRDGRSSGHGSDEGRVRAPGRGFSTRAIRAATRAPDVTERPYNVPIYQTVTFATEDAETLADVLADRRAGYAYSRLDNPTAEAMGRALADVEGAEAGYAFGSGMAAVHAALVSILHAGDRIVASKAVYGSTHALLVGPLARFGVETAFVDPTDADEVAAALATPTRAVYLETISNPTLVVPDLAALIERAHRADAVAIVDNTFASPYLCRPAELGADLVVESCTKWIGGHSDVLAGVVVGTRERIAEVRATQIDTGGIVAPFSAFLVLRGLETLAVRMERHCATALALARELEARPTVGRVIYPGLASHPQAAVAQRLLRAGGGMLSFDLGSRQAAARFIDALVLAERTASLGATKTIATHPPSTSHRQLDDRALAAAGIPPGLVRVSVGLEDVDDLSADFAAAIAAARPTVPA
jgi:cystathionine beta-lyase/cystathionine gamma-synthase